MPTLDCILDFAGSGIQSLLQRLGAFRTSSGQSGAQVGHGRGREEEKDRVQGRVVGLDKFDSLCINVQDTSSGLLAHILNGFGRGSISVARKLGIFNEFAVVDHVDKLGVGDKVVVDTVHLARTRRASGVRDGEAEFGRMGSQETVQKGGLAGSGWTANNERLMQKLGSMEAYIDIVHVMRLTRSILGKDRASWVKNRIYPMHEKGQSHGSKSWV